MSNVRWYEVCSSRLLLKSGKTVFDKRRLVLVHFKADNPYDTVRVTCMDTLEKNV